MTRAAHCSIALSPVLALVLACTAAVAAAYPSPDAAVTALAAAVAKDDVAAIEAVLGRGSRKLADSGDAVADKTGRANFTAAFDAKHSVETSGDTATLVIGTDDYPFPIPLVHAGDGWSFDVKAGAREILDRRIGRNELTAIDVCRAIVDAERDYAAEFAQYAGKFVSDPGKKNGLYWPATAGGPESPLGPLVASARAQGYHGHHTPYHGYYFKLLAGQGPHAADGARTYLVKGRMIGGFAIVAYPAKWGDSGVMSFTVNQDGIVHERNLGRDTSRIAARITRYDPDPDWKEVK
ncbi:MAG TPA: DUF2950 domain-containing protein [Stellaceae bacterium]|nr:DUF2950 domain-containing protein [Stellaceae bacterium]